MNVLYIYFIYIYTFFSECSLQINNLFFKQFSQGSSVQQATSKNVRPLNMYNQSSGQLEFERNYNTMSNQQERPLRSSYLMLLGSNESSQQLDSDARLVPMKQPLHSKYINVTMNPYNVSENIGGSQRLENDGMLATQYLRDSVYMNPKLMQLTNTLRRGKKVCQGGHLSDEMADVSLAQMRRNHGNVSQQPQEHKNDSTMLPESEVVFRAVSPHGHVYWEIDPTRSQTMDADEANHHLNLNQNSNTGTSNTPGSSSQSFDNSQVNKQHFEGMINQTSERRLPVRYDESLGPQDFSDVRPTILVNPFADVNMIGHCQSPSKSSTSTSMTTDGSSLNVSPAQLRNIKSYSRYNSPISKTRSEDKDKVVNSAKNSTMMPRNNKNNLPLNSQKSHEAASYASNSVSSSSTSTTSASSSLSTPSKANEQEPSQNQIPVTKDVKIVVPQVSVKGKDFFISKIQNHISNGASGIKIPNGDGSTLADNMDSFLSSLSGSKRKKV